MAPSPQQRPRASDAPDGTGDRLRQSNADAAHKAMLTESQSRNANEHAAGKLKEQHQQPTASLPHVEITHDHNAAEKTVAALKSALDRKLTSFGPAVPDVVTVEALLRNASPAQLKDIRETFEHTTGKSLYNYMQDHTQDVDFRRLAGLAYRNDGSNDIAEITRALEQLHWWVQGPSNETLETTIRTKLSRLNSDDIQKLCDQYHFSHSNNLPDALLKDKQLSDSTKQAIGIYLHGVDKRTDEETLKLFDLALKERSLAMLQEASQGASETARKLFFDADGEHKLDDAFRLQVQKSDRFDGLLDSVTLGFYSARDAIDTLLGKKLDKALEIAHTGKVSEATQVYENKALLGNNREAIAQVLYQMNDADRQTYFIGKAKSNANNQSLTKEESDAVSYYTKLHDQLSSAAGRLGAFIGQGHERELLKWEDMIRTQGGGLVARLAEHGGYIYNDSKEQIFATIENMTAKEWQIARNDPDSYKKNVASVLSIVLNNENDRQRAISLFDEKLKQDNLFAAQGVGRRPVSQVIADNQGLRSDTGKLVDPFGWFTSDSKTIISGLMKMSEAEKQSYRSDQKFQQKLDADLQKALGVGSAYAVAHRILTDIKAGVQPGEDIIVKLYMCSDARITGNATAATMGNAAMSVNPLIGLAMGADATLNHGRLRGSLVGSGAAEPIRVLEEALAGPSGNTLREKIKSDQAFRADLTAALHACLADGEFNKYAKPLLETGTLPFEKRMALDRSLLHDNRQSILNGLLLLPDKERQNILKDERVRDELLGSLPEPVRDVALNIIKQNEIAVADKIRLCIIGYGFEPLDIKNLLANPYWKMGATNLNNLESAYARKYGSDLLYDVRSNIKGKDGDDLVELIMRPPDSAREALARKERSALEHVDSLGSKIVGHFWDGTDQLTQESLENFRGELTKAARDGKQLSPAEVEQLTDNFNKSLALLRESRGALAEAAVDTGMTIAVVAGSIATAGSLGILAGAAMVGGAVVKPAAKGLMLGSDYDSSVGNILKDALSGGANGLVNCLGPGELAIALRLGERAGITAAGQALAVVEKELGNAAFKEGAQQIAERTLSKLVRDSLTHGMSDIDKKAMQELAGKLVSDRLTGYQRDAAVNKIAEQLEKELKEAVGSEGKKHLVSVLKRYALGAGAAAAGALVSSTADSAYEWNPNLPIEENLKRAGTNSITSVGFGALGAVGFTAVTDGVGHLVKLAARSARPVEAPYDPLRLPIRKIDPNENMVTRIESVSHREKVTFRGSDSIGNLSDVKKDARVYKLIGHDMEIIVPEDYAKQLDVLRNLRQTASMSVAENPAQKEAILAAQVELSKHPLRNALLPEQLGQLIDELPNSRHISRLDLVEHGRIARLKDGSLVIALADATTPSGNTTIGNVVAPATDGTARQPSIVVYIDGNLAYSLRNTIFHEWVHLTEEGDLWKTFQRAAKLEEDGHFQRPYAQENEHENYAVHFGECLLDPNPEAFKGICKDAPFRAAVMGEILKEQLAQVPENLRSPFHQQFLERVRYIEENVVPQARQIMSKNIESGDAAVLNFAHDLVGQNSILLEKLVDPNVLMRAASNTGNVETALKIATILTSVPSESFAKAAATLLPGIRQQMRGALLHGGAVTKEALQIVDRALTDYLHPAAAQFIDAETLNHIALHSPDADSIAWAGRDLAKLSHNKVSDQVIDALVIASRSGKEAHDLVLEDLQEIDSAKARLDWLKIEAGEHNGLNIYELQIGMLKLSSTEERIKVFIEGLPYVYPNVKDLAIRYILAGGIEKDTVKEPIRQYLKSHGMYRPELELPIQ